MLIALTAPLAEPFFLRALVAGILLAVAASFVGVFVVLRRISFFGDAVGHFAFTGIALGFLVGINPILAAVVFSILIALGIGYLDERSTLASDTTIGVFFAGAVAFGIFLIGLLTGYRADLFQYLFGDILAITTSDILTAAVLLGAVLLITAFIWRPLIAATFNRDLARVYDIPVRRAEYLFLVLLATVASLSIKTVGILLVTALLIVPAAAAKNVSKSFRQLLTLTVAISLVSVVGGLLGSYYWNTASGPTIVLTSLFFFVVTLIW